MGLLLLKQKLFASHVCGAESRAAVVVAVVAKAVR